MAYGDSGQAKVRVFSNPDITFCGGFACGVPNQADNARSLRQTIPIIAAFRAAVAVPGQPPVGTRVALGMDANGDGKSDLIWYHYGAQQIAYWFMNGVNISQRGDLFSGGDYRVISTGDYNGDSRDDLLWPGCHGRRYGYVVFYRNGIHQPSDG